MKIFIALSLFCCMALSLNNMSMQKEDKLSGIAKKAKVKVPKKVLQVLHHHIKDFKLLKANDLNPNNPFPPRQVIL